MHDNELKEKITFKKREKNALILAHNYQSLEVQQIADACGDSLELSRFAAKAAEQTIVFCGVKFMAETAKILAPQKKVLLPRLDAGCPMADMITPAELIALKKEHPLAAVVTYVNSDAQIKALSDICCTSANAVNIVKSLEQNEIIFIPDQNLGYFVQQRVPQKKFFLFEGYCYVHNRIKRWELEETKQKFPQAVVIVHPEVPPDVQEIADEILSTSKMIRFIAESSHNEFVLATEEGLLERLRADFPDKKIHSAYRARICSNMKKTTLEDVLLALESDRYQIELAQQIITDACKPLQKMIEIN